jgi:hypothetical protein
MTVEGLFLRDGLFSEGRAVVLDVEKGRGWFLVEELFKFDFGD